MIVYTNRPAQKFRLDQKYFSDDDGKTWYADSIDRIPPYQHDGKTAYAAQVYSYAGGSKQFCGYLIRFPDNVKAQVEKNGSSNGKTGLSAGQIAWNTETALPIEVKAPSSPGPWVANNSPAAGPIVRVHAPDGSELDQVLP